MKFILTTDTSCDALKTDLDAQNIPWIPLTFTLDGTTYDDNYTTNEQYVEFYKKVAAGAKPVTSQINTFAHEEFFKKVLAANPGLPIVHLTLSGGLSETVNSARLASANVESSVPGSKVYIIDTLSATQGHMIIVDKGIALRDSGADAEAAATELASFTNNVMHWFMVDDLHHLKRGGRVGAASAFIGTLLKIKPILTINHEGKLVVVKKAKGASGAIKIFLEQIEQQMLNKDDGTFYIVSASADKYANELKARLIEVYPNCTIKGGWIGPVIGAHTGCGTFGVAFVGKERLTISK